jgi:hypothetical protein
MIYAMFAMILLTFSVAYYMFRLRVKAVKTGHLKLSYFRLNAGVEAPANITQAARNYSNLFEVPVLFYTAGTLAIALNVESTIMIIVSWIFVISRVAHSWIHLTNNNVIQRMRVFMLGNLCVLLIWGQLVWQYTIRTL